MRPLLIAIIVSLAACSEQESPRDSDSVGTAAPDAPIRSQVQNSELAITAPRDSAARIAPDDSILDTGPNRPVVLPNGDTLTNLGGQLMTAGASERFGIGHYTKNATHYLRIHRHVGHKLDGKPIRVLLARLRLPPMDSTDNWTEGMCQVNGKSDASILAITSTVGESPFNARHAWRFDQATETLREIPTAGVTCYHAGLEEDSE